MIQHRIINLPKGGELELQIHEGFYDKVRQHYGKMSHEDVTDDDIRMFIFGATKTAIDKIESKEITK